MTASSGKTNVLPRNVPESRVFSPFEWARRGVTHIFRTAFYVYWVFCLETAQLYGRTSKSITRTRRDQTKENVQSKQQTTTFIWRFSLALFEKIISDCLKRCDGSTKTHVIRNGLLCNVTGWLTDVWRVESSAEIGVFMARGTDTPLSRTNHHGRGW